VERLADAGLDSIRISLNSVREDSYNRYYQPQGYTFDDVRRAVFIAREKGLFTMLNYLVFPGLTDQRDEIEALVDLIGEAGVDLIQMRNLSLDPVLYCEAMGINDTGTGMFAMLQEIKQRVPNIQYGYFNRTRERFYPENHKTTWPQ
jgi:molybdenum cofactor biosynthesis enzyme MoaA